MKMLYNGKRSALAFTQGARLIAAAAVLVLCAVGALAAPAPERVEREVGSLLPGRAEWAMAVTRLGWEKRVSSFGPSCERALAPGSVVNLFTAGAFLNIPFREDGPPLVTTVRSAGRINGATLIGDLYLVGGGNPLLSSPHIHKLVQDLMDRGIKAVDGDIVVDDFLFDSTGLERKRVGAAYAAPGALGLDLHTVAVTVSPGAVGLPPVVTLEPANSSVVVAVDAVTVDAAGSVRVNLAGDHLVRVTGTISSRTGKVTRRFPLRDPALYAGEHLRDLLEKESIRFDGKVRRGKAPAGAAVLGDVTPPETPALLQYMNVHNLNVLADNLFLLLGRERFGLPGTRDKGSREVQGFLSSLGFPVADARVLDGCGLNEEDKVTAGHLANYLYKISDKPWFATFRDSLPKAGIGGGTSGGAFNDPRFRVKTGKLPDAYALAGYGIDKAGNEVAFAFIVNAPGVGLTNVNKIGSDVLKYISAEEWL